MTVAYRVVPASSMHVPYLAQHMRAADQREVWASHRHTPAEALMTSFLRSPLAWTCIMKDRPVLMCGVAGGRGLYGLTGRPWLLATDDIADMGREFIRQSRFYVDWMQGQFPYLENYVHAENRLSLRWLRWCGFHVDEEAPALFNGEEFYRFWRMRHHV